MESPLFEERQYLPTWARLLVMLDVPIVVIIVLAVKSRSDEGFPVLPILALTFAVTLLVYFIHLSTLVQPGRITVRLWPFPARTLPTSEIETFEARRYSPLREYGGWGIKGTRKNRAYNAQGNLGVQLVMKSGERVLIGSQRPDDLVSALEIAKQMQD